MSLLLRCNPGCGKTEEFAARHKAISAGWVAATIETKAGPKYFMCCPDCVPKWVRDATATADAKKGKHGA
jgi:hypothetical protein